MTLNDPERQNRGFMDFLAISGCDIILYVYLQYITYINFGLGLPSICQKLNRVSSVTSLHMRLNNAEPTPGVQWNLRNADMLKLYRDLPKTTLSGVI